MSLFRLAYFSVLPPPLVADTGLLDLEFSRFVQRRAQVANAQGLTGAVVCNPPFLAVVIEGSRRNVNEAFIRAVADTTFGPVTIIGAEPVESRAFSHWAASPIEHLASGSVFRPDRATLDELTKLTTLAVDDILDVSVAS